MRDRFNEPRLSRWNAVRHRTVPSALIEVPIFNMGIDAPMFVISLEIVLTFFNVWSAFLHEWLNGHHFLGERSKPGTECVVRPIT